MQEYNESQLLKYQHHKENVSQLLYNFLILFISYLEVLSGEKPFSRTDCANQRVYPADGSLRGQNCNMTWFVRENAVPVTIKNQILFSDSECLENSC